MKSTVSNKASSPLAMYLALLATLLGWALPTDLLAVPITYTWEAFLSGNLDGTDFSNNAVHIVLSGDTANVVNQGGGLFTNVIGTAAVEVFNTSAGNLTDTFTDNLSVFSLQSADAFGIGDDSRGGADLIDLISSSFGSYDLKTAIGPISPLVFSLPTLALLGTSGGTFTITSTTNGARIVNSFEASVISAVPEPTSLCFWAVDSSA